MKQVDYQGNVYDIGIEANGFSDKALEQIVGLIRPILNEKDKEIERLNKGLEYAKRIEKDYKTKFDKAIEYVNTHKPSDTISFPLMRRYEENQVISCFDYEFEKIYKKELLDILQGDDNE